MRSTSLLHPGSLRTFSRRGLAWLLTMSLGTTLISAASAAQAQETRALFHTQRGFRAKLDTVPGLYVATYQTPEGKILVYLPDDLHTGESVVGTMRLQPNGKDDSERAPHLAALSTYHFLWGKQSQAAQEMPLTWTLPPDEPREAGTLTLADAQDHALAQTDLPVAATLPSAFVKADGAANAQASGSTGNSKNHLPGSKVPLPRRGVVGRPLVLKAPVGTEALTYQVLVGDKPARLLAASPRVLIVESPGMPGKTTLQVKKDGQIVAESPFQNDRVTGRINPWPYVLGAGLVLGIVIAVSINNTLRELGGGL